MIIKADLAQSYYPNSTPSTAMRQLLRDIASNPELLEALHRTGYNASSHKWYFTDRQQKIIKKFGGQPLVD